MCISIYIYTHIFRCGCVNVSGCVVGKPQPHELGLGLPKSCPRGPGPFLDAAQSGVAMAASASSAVLRRIQSQFRYCLMVYKRFLY